MKIGIDLGGTKIEGIVLDQRLNELRRVRVPTPVLKGYEAVVRSVAEVVSDLERDFDSPLPVGIGTPGTISRKTGMMKNSNSSSLNHRPFQEDLQS